jgi:hypothetical protein
MIALCRKYAALRLFHYYASRALKNTTGIKRVVDLNKLQAGLASNFDQIEVLLQLLKDYLAVGRDGPNAPKRYVARNEFVNEFSRLLEKSRGVAELLKAYATNGDELLNSTGRPSGIKIMREALRRAQLVTYSQRTLLKYYGELEPTAVFHYLMRIHHCNAVLHPLDRYDKDFSEKIMKKAQSVDELRDVCRLYNLAVAELNRNYGFNFTYIDNIPKSETETTYDALISQKVNKKLTDAIQAVTGHTGG